ncbi:MAG TPA: hypothetical protein VM223_24395 [Planctomycetota bacterium]|nr:hypothetical protein [Planctomycetota bacterium]
MKYLSMVITVICIACGCTSKNAWPPVSEYEQKNHALKTDLPGDPPKNGLRYWKQPFRSIGAGGAYVTVIIRDGQYELWHNTWGDSIDQRQISTGANASLRFLPIQHPLPNLRHQSQQPQDLVTLARLIPSRRAISARSPLRRHRAAAATQPPSGASPFSASPLSAPSARPCSSDSAAPGSPRGSQARSGSID